MIRESSISNVFGRERSLGKANVLLHVGRNALDRDAHFPDPRDHSLAVVNPHTNVLSYGLLHRVVLSRCRWVSERRLPVPHLEWKTPEIHPPSSRGNLNTSDTLPGKEHDVREATLAGK